MNFNVTVQVFPGHQDKNMNPSIFYGSTIFFRDLLTFSRDIRVIKVCDIDGGKSTVYESYGEPLIYIKGEVLLCSGWNLK